MRELTGRASATKWPLRTTDGLDVCRTTVYLIGDRREISDSKNAPTRPIEWFTNMLGLKRMSLKLAGPIASRYVRPEKKKSSDAVL